eukprot:CAMPEP_0185723252 /NCGR_PEP_ID=MMETSP1171-20130828/155_1 /TAXON_ID=374046 /ORGANISM="Helicotheca tamensis, Strain CCMP826" /LENGTH=224 /DNA_ID=CAMNT_0028390923 /DNA_START=16 /DNA_END=686 /DNA_ORIENTATION=+
MRLLFALFLSAVSTNAFVVTPNGRRSSIPLFSTLDTLSVPELTDLVKEQYSGKMFGTARQARMLKKLKKKQDLISYLDNLGVDGPEVAKTTTEAEAPELKAFDKVQESFPGALSNAELTNFVKETLKAEGYDDGKTLVATSLCCDEVNRPLESDLSAMYDTNFNMGGLAGFPFGGATSFGAMAAHIPDGGSCVVVYGPHVGVDSTGAVGTVERRGRANGGSCCG